MTAITKANVISATLGSVFVDGVTASISELGLSAFDSSRYAVFPGFCDVHVHFREPGFSYKETIATGSYASARGGYTAVCTMPNLNPVPDSVEHLVPQLQAICDGACIHVYPIGAITVGEKGEQLADLEDTARFVKGFSDDGRGVQTDGLMREAMVKAKQLGKSNGSCSHISQCGSGKGFSGTNLFFFGENVAIPYGGHGPTAGVEFNR